MRKLFSLFICSMLSVSALNAAIPGLEQTRASFQKAKEWTLKNKEKASRLWFCFRNPNQCSQQEVATSKKWVYGLGGAIAAAAVITGSLATTAAINESIRWPNDWRMDRIIEDVKDAVGSKTSISMTSRGVISFSESGPVSKTGEQDINITFKTRRSDVPFTASELWEAIVRTLTRAMAEKRNLQKLIITYHYESPKEEIRKKYQASRRTSRRIGQELPLPPEPKLGIEAPSPPTAVPDAPEYGLKINVEKTGPGGYKAAYPIEGN